jgi:hypothetical protein
MHRFSAWRTEPMLFAARENVLVLVQLFEAREADNIWHIFASTFTPTFDENENFCASR